jgi:cell division protein FtsW
MSSAGKTETRSRQPDYLLLAVVGMLLMLGLQAVYSASFVLGLSQFDDATYFVKRQGMWAAVGAILLLICARVDYHRWKALSPWFMFIGVGLLVAVMIPAVGVVQNGSARWIRLGPLPSPQPSEFVKIVLIMYMSAWLSTRGEKLERLTLSFVPFTIVVSLVCGLILMEPDMGTAVVTLITAVTLYFLAGGRIRHMTLLALSGMGASFLMVTGAGYRLDRWLTFVNPWADSQGKGFHIIQSLIALGSGGLFGLGPGASRQKFFYVPGSHTDSIYAIIGEEMGLIGTMLVIVLFSALIYRGFKAARQAPDEFGYLLALGIICLIGYQALINMAGITRSIPLTGITLPFISYGGSSLASFMAGIGILLNISKQAAAQNGKTRPKSNGGPRAA